MLLVAGNPYGLSGRKATLIQRTKECAFRVQELSERRGGRPGWGSPSLTTRRVSVDAVKQHQDEE